MSEGLLRLPRLGETMETGRIVAWTKRPGEAFRRGETLAEIETDKTVVEMPALADGVLLEILAEPGDEVEVDAPIARLAREGGTPLEPEAEAARGDDAREAQSSLDDRDVKTAARAASGRSGDRRAPAGDRLRATPAARRVARERGVELASVSGTGPRGRIEQRDVDHLGSTEPISGEMAVPGGALAWRRWPAHGTARAEALLLHGFAADAGTWIELAPRLTAAGIGCQALDLPSHGRSRHEGASLAAVADALEAGFDALPARPDILIGHSLGGLLVAELALRRPAGLRGLLLLAPAGTGPQIDADLLARLATAESAEALDLLLRRLGGRLPPPPASVLETVVRQNRAHPGLAALAEDLAGTAARPGQRHSLPARLAQLDMPVAAVIGRDDNVVPWRQALTLPPEVALHLVPGIGHVPHWEAPDLVARLAVRLTATGGTP